MHPDVKRYYATAYQAINYCGISGWATKSYHRAIEQPFNSDTFFSSVLELGAGQGEHLSTVRHGFDDYTLLDLEPLEVELSEVTRERSSSSGKQRISSVVGDAMDLPFADESFDRAVHACLLHHLPDPERALKEIRRVLRPNAIASLYLPCDPGWLYTSVQRVTTGRKIRKALKAGSFNISAEYLRALEHPNHFPGLRALVKEVFKSDEIKQHSFPFGFESFHVNFYSVYHIRKTCEST